MKKIIYSLILILNVGFAYSQCPQGSISLSGSGTVNINSGQTYCIAKDASFTGSVNNNGGTLINNGTCIPKSLNFNGGNIVNNNIITITFSSTVNSNCTFTNNGTAEFKNSFTVNSNGNIINTGSLIINSTSTNNGRITNSGTLVYNSAFTNNSGGIITNSGSFSTKSNFLNNASITNTGTISITGTYMGNGGATFINQNDVFVTSTFTNNGTFNNTGLISASNFIQNNKPITYTECPTGSISITSNNFIILEKGKTYCIPQTSTFTGTITNNGGTLHVYGTFKPSSFLFSSGIVLNYGNSIFSSNVKLNTNCIYTNIGLTSFNGGMSNINGTLNNRGAIIVKKTSSNSGVIVNTGSIEAIEQFTNTINASILNTGSVKFKSSIINSGKISTSQSFLVVGNVTNKIGGEIISSQDFTVQGNFYNSSKFSNNGIVSISGNYVVNSGGSIHNEGTITIIKNLTNIGTIINNGIIRAANYIDDKTPNQTPRIVGTIAPPVVPNNFIAYDQNGKGYTREDLKIKNSLLKSSSDVLKVEAGIFRIHFIGTDINGGNYGFFDETLGEQRRNCMIQVCKDLSVLIESIPDNEFFKPDIDGDGQIDDKFIEIKITSENLGSSVLGYSSILTNASNKAISPTLMQEYLLTGVDPTFDGIHNYYHGIFGYNFGFNWHIDFTQKPTGGSTDLYSVALHELVHSLGFSSKLPTSIFFNTPKIQFSLFDTFIENELGEKLITVAADNSSVTRNVNINIADYYMQDPSKKMFFNIYGEKIPIYIGTNFNNDVLGSVFSHFGEEQSNDYVMSASIGFDVTNRYLLPDEVKALKLLGYNTSGKYGDGNAILYYTGDTQFTGATPLSNNTIIEYSVTTPTVIYPFPMDDYASVGLNQEYVVYTVNAGESITINFLENDINAFDVADFKENDYYYVTHPTAGFVTVKDFNETSPITADYFNYSSEDKKLRYTPDAFEPSHTRLFTYNIISENGIKSWRKGKILINVISQPIESNADCNRIVNGNLEKLNQPRDDGRYDYRQRSFNTDVIGWKTLLGYSYLEVYNPQHKNGRSSLSPSIEVSLNMRDKKAQIYGKIDNGLTVNELYVFNANLTHMVYPKSVSAYGTFYLNLNEPMPSENFNYKFDEFQMLSTTNPNLSFETIYLKNYKKYVKIDNQYKYIIFEVEQHSEEDSREVLLVFNNLKLELADKFTVTPTQDKTEINTLGTINSNLKIELDPRCLNQKFGFEIQLQLPAGVTLVSSNGYFDTQGNLITPITGLSSTNNVLNIPIVITATTLGNKEIKIVYTYHSCSMSETEEAKISFTVSENLLTWEEIVTNGGEGINPQGKEWFVLPLGPGYADAIRNESLKSEYDGYATEQEKTIAAAKALFGNGCYPMIAAQDAWFGLGLYNNYEYNYEYTLTSPENDISSTLHTFYHGDSYISASNKILAGAHVEYKAGDYIDFTSDGDGFNAEEGSDLYAFIIECVLLDVASLSGESKSATIQESNLVENVTNKDLNNEGFEVAPPKNIEPTCTIMPNPTSGNLRIVTEGQTISKIKLLSINGSKIKELDLSSKEVSFDIHDNPDGTYVLKVTTECKEYTYRIVLKK